MDPLIPTLMSAVAVLLAPLIAVVSRRATRESRLLARVQRLGNVYALLPESDEKAKLAEHLRRVTADLNEWIDPGNRGRRTVVWLAGVLLYVLSVTALVLWGPRYADDPGAAMAASLIVGVAISALVVIFAAVLSRTAVRRQSAADAARRHEAIRTAAKL